MSRDTANLESAILGRRPGIKPNPGGATFAEGVIDHSDSTGMFFKVPQWDAGKHMFGPCPWPNTGAPVRGDRCLVLFPTGDNDGIDGPWVIGWWPA